MATKAKTSKGESTSKAKAGHAEEKHEHPEGAAHEHPLAAELAAHLKISAAAVIDRALEALAEQVGLHDDAEAARARGAKAAHDKSAKADEVEKARVAANVGRPGGYLPQRLYLSLDGRGLDGGGLPVEVIEVPCTIGSGRRNTIWINSPQIETVHAQITHTDDGWVFEDRGAEFGTFLNDERVKRVVIHDGDTFLLAGYLRMKAALR